MYRLLRPLQYFQVATAGLYFQVLGINLHIYVQRLKELPLFHICALYRCMAIWPKMEYQTCKNVIYFEMATSKTGFLWKSQQEIACQAWGTNAFTGAGRLECLCLLVVWDVVMSDYIVILR